MYATALIYITNHSVNLLKHEANSLTARDEQCLARGKVIGPKLFAFACFCQSTSFSVQVCTFQGHRSPAVNNTVSVNAPVTEA